MPVRRLPGITNSPNNPVPTDTFIGVHGGNTDYQFSLAQVAGGLSGSGFTRTILTANQNYYVAVGGSDSNNGLSPATAWATLQHAMSVGATMLDLAGFQVFVNIGVGTFHGAGQQPTTGGGTWAWLGAGSASTTIIEGSGISSIYNNGEAWSQYYTTDTIFWLNGMTMSSATSGYAVIGMNGPGWLSLGNNNTFTTDLAFNLPAANNTVMYSGGTFCWVFTGSGTITLNFSPANTAAAGVVSLTAGCIFNDNPNTIWAINGNPTWGAFASFATLAEGCIYYNQGPLNFTGTATGPPVTLTSKCAFVSASVPLGLPPGSTTCVVDATSSLNLQNGAASISGIPTTSNVLPGLWNIFKDTSGGGVYFVFNDAGSIVTLNVSELTSNDGAHIIAIREGTTAQTFRVYNTFTNSSNYERAIFDWSTNSNILTIGTVANGSGTVRGINFVSGANSIWDFAVSFGSVLTVSQHLNLASNWYFRKDTGALIGNSASLFGWSSGSINIPAATADTGFARNAANVVEINNGIAGTGPGVILPRSTTFANLPASPVQGMMVSITDGLAANCADGSCTTFGTNVTGGTGALKLNLWYNGTHWTLMGK